VKTLRVRLSVPALVLALVVAGCSSDDKRPAAAGSSTTTVSGPTSSTGPLARRVVDLTTEGFTIEIPDRWKEVVINAAALQRLTEEQGGKLDQAITAQIRVLAQRNGKLFAYDDAKRTTNLNVLKIPSTSGATIEQLTQGLAAQLTEQKLRDVKVEPVTLPGGRPGAKASGTATVTAADGRTADLFQLQYYALSGSFTFVAILATDDPARDQPTMEAVGQTFTVL
jgi:ABC-type glycerol-3-phosphate transport system substrate-binding protein